MSLSQIIKDLLLQASRYRCAICSSKDLLHMVYIQPLRLGGQDIVDNLIILCPTCHTSVDSFNLSPSILSQIKLDWIERNILGRGEIIKIAQDIARGLGESGEESLGLDPTTKDFLKWAKALEAKMTFDDAIRVNTAQLASLENEDEFLHEVLRPIFEYLGFEGITILHHSGELEHGKDMVFYQRDALGSFTFYAVVACNMKIHALSSRTSDSGHYAKIIDQVKKCFIYPWRDHNLKMDPYIDKVIVATPHTITEEAMDYFRSWENDNKRHLIFLDGQVIAGYYLKRTLK